MENKILSLEQREFLLSKMWEDTKEFCEAIVSNNTDKVVHYLGNEADNDWGLYCAEAIFLMRYGNIEMKSAYLEKFTPSRDVVEYVISFEKDQNIATKAFVQYLKNNIISIQMFEKCLDICDVTKVIPILSEDDFENDDWQQVHSILQKRDNPLELALFYTYNSDLTPDGFWKNPENSDVIINNPSCFCGISKETLLYLLPHTAVCKALPKIVASQFDADMAIVMFTKGAYSVDDILAYCKTLFCTADLEKLYDCDVNLFNAIVKVMQVSWHDVFINKIRSEVLEIILDTRLNDTPAAAYVSHIIRHPHVNVILKVVARKKLWNNDIIRRIIYKQHNEFVLLWLQNLNSVNNTLELNESNIIQYCNYECIEYMIDKFGLQDKENEKYFAELKLRETREKAIQLYHDKYGFKSKEGKKLWIEFKKEHAPKLSIWQRIKKSFS